MNSLPGPQDIGRTVFPNGITLLTRSNFASPSVVLAGYFPAGARFDPPGMTGLANFASLMLLRGTTHSTFGQLSERLESIGASLGFGAGTNHINFGGRCLTEDLPKMLALLVEVLREASFPAEQIKRLRGQMLTSLSIRDQDTSERVEMALDDLLFPDHPYGRPVEGWPASVRAITREALISFHQLFSPCGFTLAIVGGVQGARAAEMTAQALGGWPAPQNCFPNGPLPPYQPVNANGRLHIPLPDKVQTDLGLACHGPARLAPEYLAASLANNILGQFGMSGRLGESLREKAGLAYSVGSVLSAWMDGGSWQIGAGVNPADLDQALELILNEVQRLRDDGVTWRELQDSQAHYIGRLPLSLESNNGVANALLQMEHYGLGMDYFHTYAARVNAIRPEDVQAAAVKWLDPLHMVIASCGSGENG